VHAVNETTLKALRWRRAGARLIDSLVALVLLPAVLIPVAVGALPGWVFQVVSVSVSLWYLASDRFPLGKRLMRLAVVDAVTGAPCTLNQSVTRNLIFGVHTFVHGGVALLLGTTWKAFAETHQFAALGIDLALLALAFVEASRVDAGRPRLGDHWAGTTVVDLRAPGSTSTPGT
jgi:uncharacterized RDD family membrane protein YckC